MAQLNDPFSFSLESQEQVKTLLPTSTFPFKPTLRRCVHFGSDHVKVYDPKEVPNAESAESSPVVVAVPLAIARPSILRRRRSSSAAAPADPPVIDLSINVGEKVRHVVVPFVTSTNDDACFVSVHQEQELEPSQAAPKTKRPPRPRVSNGGAPLRRSARLAAKNPRRSPRLAAKRLAAKP
jgi:hypothetical protein